MTKIPLSARSLTALRQLFTQINNITLAMKIYQANWNGLHALVLQLHTSY